MNQDEIARRVTSAAVDVNAKVRSARQRLDRAKHYHESRVKSERLAAASLREAEAVYAAARAECTAREKLVEEMKKSWQEARLGRVGLDPDLLMTIMQKAFEREVWTPLLDHLTAGLDDLAEKPHVAQERARTSVPLPPPNMRPAPRIVPVRPWPPGLADFRRKALFFVMPPQLPKANHGPSAPPLPPLPDPAPTGTAAAAAEAAKEIVAPPVQPVPAAPPAADTRFDHESLVSALALAQLVYEFATDEEVSAYEESRNYAFGESLVSRQKSVRSHNVNFTTEPVFVTTEVLYLFGRPESLRDHERVRDGILVKALSRFADNAMRPLLPDATAVLTLDSPPCAGVKNLIEQVCQSLMDMGYAIGWDGHSRTVKVEQPIVRPNPARASIDASRRASQEKQRLERAGIVDPRKVNRDAVERLVAEMGRELFVYTLPGPFPHPNVTQTVVGGKRAIVAGCYGMPRERVLREAVRRISDRLTSNVASEDLRFYLPEDDAQALWGELAGGPAP